MKLNQFLLVGLLAGAVFPSSIHADERRFTYVY